MKRALRRSSVTYKYEWTNFSFTSECFKKKKRGSSYKIHIHSVTLREPDGCLAREICVRGCREVYTDRWKSRRDRSRTHGTGTKVEWNCTKFRMAKLREKVRAQTPFTKPFPSTLLFRNHHPANNRLKIS